MYEGASARDLKPAHQSPPLDFPVVEFFKIAFPYSRFICAMKSRLISFGHTASFSPVGGEIFVAPDTNKISNSVGAT